MKLKVLEKAVVVKFTVLMAVVVVNEVVIKQQV